MDKEQQNKRTQLIIQALEKANDNHIVIENILENIRQLEQSEVLQNK